MAPWDVAAIGCYSAALLKARSLDLASLLAMLLAVRSTKSPITSTVVPPPAAKSMRPAAFASSSSAGFWHDASECVLLAPVAAALRALAAVVRVPAEMTAVHAVVARTRVQCVRFDADFDRRPEG